MILRKIFISAISCLIVFAACKKESSESKNGATAVPDDCVQSAAAASGSVIEGQYIVLYKNNAISSKGITAQRMTEFNQDALSRNNISEKALEKSFAGEPGGFIAALSESEAARLRKDENIEAIEPDRIIALSNCFTVVEPRLITWNIQRIGYGNGIGKRAWLIDTGIDFDHPDLTVDVSKSKSFISGVTSADDENGHGTHVAGIIGAKNNTFGVLGVASGATLVSCRVLDKDGSGSLSNIIQALSYISANASRGDVVNMSVGDDDGISEILDRQVQTVAAKGILFSIAAGNEHTDANKYSPGRAAGPNIFTVTAIDSLDNFASFSNYGNDVVDYAMPGVKILSTYMGNKYAYMSGTSMAAPHMAGLLLLKGAAISKSGFAKNDPDGTPDPIAHF
jgi:subtilisin